MFMTGFGNPGSLFDGRLINEHDGNIVLDWIHAMARIALESGPVVDEHHRRFAIRACQNFQQFSVERHVSALHYLIVGRQAPR
jgi:hypothetical protein